jgi:uncharacterized protein (TIGR01777 family)
MKILITGVTGLIGKQLALDLLREGHEVSALSRNPKQIAFLPTEKVGAWTHDGRPSIDRLRGLDAIIHLAGENVASKRWTPQRKQLLIDSRILGTKNLITALTGLKSHEQPKVLIAASAIGFYGDAGESELDERSPGSGDFLANLCESWEQAGNLAKELGIRVVNLRTGIVLAKDGGALAKMGPVILAGGEQWMSWIHIDDVVGIIKHAITQESISGPINLVSPNPVRQKDFAQCLKQIRKYPLLMKVPRLMLQMALGEMAAVVLASQKVKPTRALNSGYRFQFPNLALALSDLFKDQGPLDQRFSSEQFIGKKRNQIIPFFSRAENLEELTPPWLNFRILKKSSPEIKNGTIIEYQLKIHGVPVKWRTLISDWNLPNSFTDEQLKGPYSKWHHVHSFHEVNDGTLLTDQVTYRVPLSWLGKLFLSRWIAKDVQTLFNFRKQKILDLVKEGRFS